MSRLEEISIGTDAPKSEVLATLTRIFGPADSNMAFTVGSDGKAWFESLDDVADLPEWTGYSYSLTIAEFGRLRASSASKRRRHATSTKP